MFEVVHFLACQQVEIDMALTRAPAEKALLWCVATERWQGTWAWKDVNSIFRWEATTMQLSTGAALRLIMALQMPLSTESVGQEEKKIQRDSGCHHHHHHHPECSKLAAEQWEDFPPDAGADMLGDDLTMFGVDSFYSVTNCKTMSNLTVIKKP